MPAKRTATKANNKNSEKKTDKNDTLCYRLKCAKTANGLSHFVMYGDVEKDKALL